MTLEEYICKLRNVATVGIQLNLDGMLPLIKQNIEFLEELQDYRKHIFSGDKTQAMLKDLTATELQKEYTNGFLAGQKKAYDECDEVARELSDIKSGCSKWLDEHDKKVTEYVVAKFLQTAISRKVEVATVKNKPIQKYTYLDAVGTGELKRIADEILGVENYG